MRRISATGSVQACGIADRYASGCEDMQAFAEGTQFQRKYLAWADFWRIIPDLFLIFMEEA